MNVHVLFACICGASCLQSVIWMFCFHRFDECAISPLTIKALSTSGYTHMTRVQETSLPICLEGMFPISCNPISIYRLSSHHHY